MGRENEAGIAALELLLALPVLALILTGIVFVVTTAANDYLRLRAQAEVQQEVQLAFVRILDDCLMADSIQKGSKEGAVRIYSEGKLIREYFVHEDSKGVRKLVENNITLPITGNHAWARVVIDSFGCKEIDPVGRPGLYRLWLQGRSTMAGSVPYKLTTEVYLQPKQGASP